MRIGSARHINEINAGHWHKMSVKAGLGWPMIRERISLIVEQVLKKISAVAEHAIEVGIASQAVGNLSKIISDRALRARDDWGR